MTTRSQSSGRFTVRDRRALFLMSLVAFVSGYGASAISHTLPFARNALELSEGGMFWIFGITRAASLAGLFFAIAADRGGRRDPLLIAFALIPTGNLLTGLLPHPVVFAVTQSVTRIGVVAVAALAVVILSEELTPGRRAFGIGIYALAGSMGAGLGLLILPLAERGDDVWRILFGAAALGLLVLPLLNRFLNESRAYAPASKSGDFSEVLASGAGRYFFLLAGMAFFIAAFASPAFDFVLERLINDLEWSTSSATLLLVVFSGIGTVGLLVGGRMADVTGRRITTVVAIVLGVVGGVAFYFVSTGPLLAAAVFLGTLGATMLTPAVAAHRAELFPTRIRATAAGMITNVAIVGSMTGFILGALVVDSIGLPRTISLLSIGLIASIWMVLQLPETKGKDLVSFTSELTALDASGGTWGDSTVRTTTESF
ncbi:MAG TPA: MFS transporter [Acidimicrobiia bacterium]|nr:MFS transporter [Acidimicrobiia bacterium]